MATDDPRVQLCHRMYDESRRVKDIVQKDWTDARDMLRGAHLPKRRPEHKPPAVLNLLRPLIERKIAMLTDTKPRFTVTPTRSGEGHANASRILDEAIQAWWDDTGVDTALMRGLLYACSYGVMVTQTRWSKLQNDISLDIIDPVNFYVDPHILTPNQLSGAEYVILEETPPLDQVKMRFGSKANAVKAWTPPARDSEPGTWATRIARRITSPFSRERDSASAVPRTLLRHYWIKDYAYVDDEVKDSATNKTVTLRRMLYPGGRYLIWAHDGSIVHDEPNPYYDMVHPFDMMDWYMDLDSPWGDSEITAHRHPQMLLNKVCEVIVENGMLMNNAIWVCDQNAFPADEGEKGWGQLTNAPGKVIKKRPGTEVRREYPQGVPTSLIQMLQHLEQFIESRAGGFSEVLTGRKPGQIQSGLGVEQLQMTASALIRLKARALEGLLQRVGQKCVSRVIQFYTNDRVWRIMGPGKEFREYQFIRSEFRDALSLPALEDAHKDFRFRIAPGSSLSLTKIQKALMAVQLYQLGCVDRQEVLQAIEWPNWSEVLKRTIAEQALGLEPGGVPKKGKQTSKKGFGPMERSAKIAGRT